MEEIGRGEAWVYAVYHVPVAQDVFGDVHNDVMVQEFTRRMGERAPIWTAVGVPALGDPKMRVEIRVTAIVDDEN